MGDGSPTDDEAEGLAAIWGREASTDAPASPRPDLAALVGAGPGPAPDPPLPRRRLLVPVAVVAAVAAGAVGVAVARSGDDDRAAPVPRTTSPADTTTTESPAQPRWTAEVVCPRFEDGSGAGRVECPLAADDQQAYVLVDAAGTPALQALDGASGQVRWEVPFPRGAETVRRTPSLVTVSGVGVDDPERWPQDRGETVALDPATGEVRWTRPGWVAGEAGRDHLVFDHEVGGAGSTITTMTVVEAATGREVLTRSGRAEDLYVHACGSSALVSEGRRLTGHDVADGTMRWSIDAPHLDLYTPLECDERQVAFVDEGRLRLLDTGSGAEVASVAVPGAGRDPGPRVVALAGDTVVVSSFAATRGFHVGDGLELAWEIPCPECVEPVAGPAGTGDDVLLVQRGVAQVRTANGQPGSDRLDLTGVRETVLQDGVLLAWGAEHVWVADAADLAGAVRMDVQGVRSAAAGPTRVVVATDAEVRAYPREG